MTKSSRSNTGLLQRLAGEARWPEFEALASTLTSQHADDVALWSFLANVYSNRGMWNEAASALQFAGTILPGDQNQLLQLAIAEFRAGKKAAARDALERLVTLEPGHSVAQLHLGLLSWMDGDLDQAEQQFTRALSFDANYVEAHVQLATLLRLQRQFESALQSIERARILAPHNPEIELLFAWILIDLHRYTEAADVGRDLAGQVPGDGRAWLVYGIATNNLMRHSEAAVALRNATMLIPNDASIWLGYAGALQETADNDGALAALSRAAQLAPDWQAPRWVSALFLPVMPRTNEVALAGCQHFERGVASLLNELDFEGSAMWPAAEDGVRLTSPFHLHYLPYDATDASMRFGKLVTKVMRRVQPVFFRDIEVRKNTGDRRLRIGYVCSALHKHTLTRYFEHSITGLNKSHFEVYAWNFSATSDDVTARIASGVDHFRTTGPASVADVAHEIKEASLDVLVFIDIGLVGRMQMLAALRLAPVQCAAYGHPVTTGLENVDYFLSAAAIEAPEGQSHYSEKLITLPGLGAVPKSPPAFGDGSWINRRSAAPVLMCLQNLIKLTPQFDTVIARIVAATRAQIVFFCDSNLLVERFLARLQLSFDVFEMKAASFVEVVPSRDYAGFLGGVAAADLVLDSLHFSGGSTSLDALGVGTPVVTCEGRWFRGRQTAGMLRMLRLDELIASNEDEYVARVADLCKSPSRRESIRKQVHAANARLFQGVDVIEALEEFFSSAATSTRHLRSGVAKQCAG